MQHDENEVPPFKGGQGRTGDDVRGTAVGCFLVVAFCAAAWAAVWGLTR